ERREPLALVTGLAGCGKSTLLARFGKHLERSGATPVRVRSGQTFPEDLLIEIASQLGCPMAGNRSTPQLWLSVKDQLAVHQLEQRHVVLLVDHAEQLSAEVVSLLRTIIRQRNPDGCGLTTFLAMAPDQVAKLDPQLREMAALRIELEPWSEADVAQYLKAAFPAQAAGFSQQAITTLHRRSGAVARRVAALADLVSMVAADEKETPIEPDLIEQVGDELLAQAGAI
ncbi:MAG: ATP-binding protein, partial [Pirellulaceae bacterium]